MLSAGTTFPSYLKLEYQPDGSAKSRFIADVNSMLDSAEGRFTEFGREAQRQLDAALSVKRNNLGSLDLGVDELQRAAQAQQARAIAAREVAEATRIAAREEGAYGQNARLSVAATEALAREEEEAARAALSHAAAAEQVQQRLNRQKSATDAVVNATRRGTTAQQNVINSTRASRTAFVQLGQQMQDVTIQAQLGTNAFTIFAQQVPQAAFALSGLERSANATQARIGRFATFMSGPWGAAIFAATAVLGPLIYNMISTGDAADDAEDKTYDFSRGLNVLELSAKQAANAMKQLAQEMRNAIKVQGDFLQTSALTADQSVRNIAGRIDEYQARLNELRRQGDDPLSVLPFAGPSAREIGKLREKIALERENLKLAQQAATDASIALGQQRAIERLDAGTAAAGRYERAVGELNQRLRESREDPLGAQLAGRFITDEQYERQFQNLTKIKEAEVKAAREAEKSNKGAEAAAARAARAAKRLADFGDRAAEKILRIREEYDETPKAIDKAAQATRELDAIVEDLSERKPVGFREMIEEAHKARQVVSDGLLRPFRDLVRESEQNLKVQELVLAGREDEARALEIIYTLQERVGLVTEDQVEEVLRLVEAQRKQTEELRAQQEIISAYTSSISGLRSDLESLLSGNLSGGGFLKSLKANFQQLQGRLLTKQLFGPFLRELEEKVRKETGIKTSVDILKEGGEDAGGAAGTLATALENAAARIDRVFAGGAADGVVQASTGGSPAFTAAFADIAAQAAANDNTTSGSSAYKDGEIVVTAARKQAAGIAGMNPNDYFERLAQGVTVPFLKKLDETLGLAFFERLKGALGGALYGYATAGTPGGILGFAKGLVDDFGGSILGDKLAGSISKGLGNALGGAQTGTQVDALFDALGIKSSSTGAQIGGALGSVFGPVGSLVGSVAGGLLGGLFGSTKRGGTIFNAGGITGTYGNSSSRKDSTAPLANAAIDQLQQLADALGGTLDTTAGKVSITLREDNLFVDPQGRGYSKQSKFPDIVGFGQDTEAAVAFAIQDLISDGVLKGIRQSTLNLIKAGGDLQQAIQKALDFENVFVELKRYKDPLGAEIDALNKEFERLIAIFTEAGATAEEWAQLEELYGLKRAEAIQRANEAITSSLQDLYDFLSYGDNGLSLRDRDTALRAEYDALAARVQAGDTTAYDDFARVSRELLDVERQLYGSQQQYFDLMDEVKALTKQALDQQAALAAASQNADNPFSASTVPANDNSGVIAAIDNLSIAMAENIGYKIDATNANLGILIQQNIALNAALATQNTGTGGTW